MKIKSHIVQSVALHRIWRGLRWMPALFILTVLIAFATVQVPKIQTELLNEVTEFVVKNTSFRLKIEKANLTWYDRMIIENVRLYHADTDSTMLAVNKVELNFGIIHYLINREIRGDKLILHEPELHLIKESDSTSINLNLFYSELKQIFSKDTTAKKSTLNFKRLELVDGILSYNDLRLTNDSSYQAFSMLNLHSTIEDLTFDGTNIDMAIQQFQSIDNPSNVNIEALRANLTLSKNSLILNNLYLKTPKSTIRDSLVLYFDNLNQLKNLKDSVKFEFALKETYIHIDDLKLLNPNIWLPHDSYTLSGKYSGLLRNLNLDQVRIGFGTGSAIAGSGQIIGLPVVKEALIDFNFNNSEILPDDIANIMDTATFSKVKTMGPTLINGEFVGFLNDFSINSTIQSKSGIIKTNLEIDHDKQGHTVYKGDLALEQFKIHQFIPSLKLVKSLDMNGTIEGFGLDANNADFILDADFNNILLPQTNISHLSTNGQFKENYFNADFHIQDSSILAKGRMLFDLRTKRKNIKLNAIINEVDLYQLKLISSPSNLRSNVELDLHGEDFDHITGYADLKNFNLDYNRNNLSLGIVNITAAKEKNSRIIELKTDGLNAAVKGKFSNASLGSGLIQLKNEVIMRLQNNEVQLANYYSKKAEEPMEVLDTEFFVEVSQPNRFLRPFTQDISVLGTVSLNSKVKLGELTNLSINVEADSVYYLDQEFTGNSLDMHLSKASHNGDIIGSLHIDSEQQNWFEQIKTQNTSVEVIWNNDEIEFWLKTIQEQFESQITINGQSQFKSNRTEINILPSQTILFGKQWQWNDYNGLVIENDRLYFNDFIIKHNNQQISISNGINRDIRLDLKNIDLSHISRLSPIQFDGLLNARLSKSFGGSSEVKSNISIFNAHLGDTDYNNIHASFNQAKSSHPIASSIRIEKNGLDMMRLTGNVEPTFPNSLDMIGEFDGFDLSLVQPYFIGKFSQIQGELDANLVIQESLLEPSISGKGEIKEGHVLIDYLQTQYEYSGILAFNKHEVIVKELSITDQSGNPAELVGSIYHYGKDELRFELDGSFERFNVLNTSSTDNSLYYGTANATGTVEFRGNKNDLIINSRARSTKGTRLSFPLGQSTSSTISQKDYIEFKSLTETNEETASSNSTTTITTPPISMKGIVMNLDLEMTNDAYMEIIFDIKSGDIIRGRGNGNLKLEVNNQGDFNMFGNYQIEEGGYNFTLYNIINKEFQINSGSTITWLGDPYGAQLDIDANYQQLASLAPLITDLNESDISSPEIKKKYPAIVELYLDGDLLTPDISFDIELQDYPRSVTTANGSGQPYDLEQYVNAFKTRASNNEQEMNRQVFSLIVLRRFSPEEGFQVSSQAIGSSFSEFISNQLSYWANQVDENLEIDVDLSSLDQEAFDTFQLRLSYTFLDGRLRVTRGGNIVNDQEREDIYSVIGDWSVEYLLTEDGRFRAKLYSRSDLNAIDRQIGENPLETGISLQYVKSFDELSNVLRSNRDKNLKLTEDKDSAY